MRLIGIDYGGRRTGIALGETETNLALPFEMFEGLTDAELARAVGQLVKREQVDAIVIGLPLHANGVPSQQSKLTERFILALQQTIGMGPGCPEIHRASEYLTSYGSEGKLAGHFTRDQKRQRVDAIAAAAILQDWMEQHR